MVLETPFGWPDLDCQFDEVADDYAQEFLVHRIGMSSAAGLPLDWTRIGADSGAPIATNSVGAIEFDVTRRAHARLPLASIPAN